MSVMTKADPEASPAPALTEEKLLALTNTAREIRKLIVKTLHKSGAGHPGGSMSVADILTVLYFHAMKVDPARPDWPERDRLVLSKGHASAGLYATLCQRGYHDKACLSTFDCVNSILQGHPDMIKTAGVDMSTGSLGQGLSVGIGMAIGLKKRGFDSRAYVILGDGELQEGQVWEAAMYAPFRKINNVTAIVDYNGLQIMGCVKEIVCLEPLADKWAAFGWNVITCNGNDIAEVAGSIEKAKAYTRGPSVIIAHTVKGKGVSYMENSVAWHSKPISDAEYQTALKELGE